jgi:hypothetical protein
MVMSKEKIENLLGCLADATSERVDEALASRAKAAIPARVGAKGGREGVRIIINLNVSRWAAAAVIFVVLGACLVILATRGRSEGGFFNDLKYSFVDATGASRDLLRSVHDRLASEGKEVVYYGDRVGTDDTESILMHWKLEDGSYNVIFGDFRLANVTAEQLIKLQSKMLAEKKSK